MSLPKTSDKYDSAKASPTPVANPCPRGPVVISIPNEVSTSGCPAVFESICLNCLMSSIEILKSLK